jgi:(E)-4-hydroxy-3-methyl-but-2-enyl pyrophosphate reductase
MKIITASSAGFCMGVRRAVDIALEQAAKSPAGVLTLGPLIHNNQTVEMLRERRVAAIDESKQVPPESTILISAHGVPPAVQQSWEPRGHVIDGTCPKVKTVHRVIEKYRERGFDIVITGDEGHAEVVGLQGYAGYAGHLIVSPQDVDGLPDFEKVCLVSQTTFDSETFDEIASRLRERFASRAEVVVKKTICSATDRRQTETRELTSAVDSMIVVGGKNSANTKRLAAIAGETGKPVQWVETELDINWDAIASSKVVGITAGASTPNWMITRITDYLTEMDRSRKKTPLGIFRYAVDMLGSFNLFVAAGAACMYYVSCMLQKFPPKPAGAVISFLYFLSMYLWNSLGSMEMTQHLDIGRYRFYRRNKPLLYILVAACMLTLLAVSSLQSRALFYLMLLGSFAGSVYHLTIVPRPLRRLLRYSRLHDVPMSRDLFVALAWAVVLTFMPHAATALFKFTVTTALTFSLLFVLAFLRSLVFDLRDIEGDRIMGRETLVTIIGEAHARRAIMAVTAAACILYAVSPLLIPTSAKGAGYYRFLFQMVPILYLYIFVRLNRGHRYGRSVFFAIFADAPFYLAGAAAWAASFL